MVDILNTLSKIQLIDLLQAGLVGVIPTDTVYGVVCLASNKNTVARLYKLKSRDQKPGTVIAASVDQLIELGLKARYIKAVQQFWPNSISIIIPTGTELEYLHQSKNSLACRVVKGPKELLNVLSITGPLLTTSANPPGKSPAGSLQEAQNYFGDSVDFYVDGGDLSSQKPSTLIRIIDDAVEVLRDGAVKVTETGEVTQ
ncbi:MAG: L-threonylcarbamoyladenylate synthase [Patescibacteria group bacterium]